MTKRVAIIGSGNWGSAIGKIVGNNVLNFCGEFDDRVPMWVFEEMVDGRKLSSIINEQHENVKYLPGVKMPENVVAIPDLEEVTKQADIFVFVMPHQFVKRVCRQMKPSLKRGSIAVSLIKGLDVDDGLRLISDVISENLGVPCYVVMGANLANEVSKEYFCEATIGASSKSDGELLKKIFQTEYFKMVICDDVRTVELCGALKNIVATGAGFIDGLGHGNNTKAAVIRLGLLEMIKFTNQFFSGGRLSTFFESCGIADIVTTCYAGRNKLVASEFARLGGKKTIEELERDLLKGQKVQGVPTAAEVNVLLKMENAENKYPLFTAVHRICTQEMPVTDFINFLETHTDNIQSVASLFVPLQ